MNVLLFLTDQQRAVQHFPPGWSARNLPGVTRLQDRGLTFENAFTNACMCSPARSTLMSGYFPAQHGVKYTLETNMPAPEYPQVEQTRLQPLS
jgi:choline-sulfatase